MDDTLTPASELSEECREKDVIGVSPPSDNESFLLGVDPALEQIIQQNKLYLVVNICNVIVSFYE